MPEETEYEEEKGLEEEADEFPESVGESLGKAVDNLSTEDKFKLLTDIDSNEIVILTALYNTAKRFGSDMLKEAIEDYCHLKVSRERLGRKELVAISANITGREVEKQKWYKKIPLIGRL